MSLTETPDSQLKVVSQYKLNKGDIFDLDLINIHLNKEGIDVKIDAGTLEWFLNAAENACFFAEPNPPLQSEELWVCAICLRDHHGGVGNFILCERCDMVVHTACYGVEKIPSGDWLCEKCLYCPLPEDADALKCILCPRSEPCAAMRRVKVINIQSPHGAAMECTRFVHSVCADTFPSMSHHERSIGNVYYSIDFKMLEANNKGNGSKCVVCQGKLGNIVSCAKKGCKMMFHPTCGQSVGYEIQVIGEDPKPTVQFLCYRHHTNIVPVSIRAKRFSSFVLAHIDTSFRPRQEILIDDLSVEMLRNGLNEKYNSQSCERVLEFLFKYWIRKRACNDGVPLDKSLAMIANVIKQKDLRLKDYSYAIGKHREKFEALCRSFLMCLDFIEENVKVIRNANFFKTMKTQIALETYHYFSEFESTLIFLMQNVIDVVPNKDEIRSILSIAILRAKEFYRSY
ncbi:hypothetical protein ACOME3_010092 [Neoechinorhynchus agilis]